MKNILIIDNDELIVSTLTTLFEQKLNFKAYASFNFETIKEYLKKTHFEIIIFDPDIEAKNTQEIFEYLIEEQNPIIVHTNNQNTLDIIRDTNVIEVVNKDGVSSIYHTYNLVQQLLRNQSMKVLVVEDSIVDQALLKHILESYKLNVYTSSNGIEALETLQQHPDIKLVITDYMMPQMNGLDLTKEIRNKYRKDKISIIVISSNDTQNISSLFLKSGANDFVHKGFTKEELYTRVNVNLEIIDLFEKNQQQYQENLIKDKQIIQQESKLHATQELLHNISHHWRQPLSVISTIASSISIKRSIGESNPQEEEKSLNQIVEHTQNLSQIIEMFQKLFNPNNITQKVDIVNYLEQYIQTHTKKEIITLHNKIENKNYKAIVCDDLFEEVLNILFTNAFEAMQNLNEPKIDIHISKIEDNISMEIIDNGKGIDEEILPKVFDLYFSTKENRNGTGVGLFVAREVIQNQFNGRITIKNNTEQTGTIVTILLPITQ